MCVSIAACGVIQFLKALLLYSSDLKGHVGITLRDKNEKLAIQMVMRLTRTEVSLTSFVFSRYICSFTVLTVWAVV